MSRVPSQPHTHPFDTPAAEAIFKGLLWIVVLLQALLLGREYNKHSQRAQRTTPAAAAAHHRSR